MGIVVLANREGISCEGLGANSVVFEGQVDVVLGFGWLLGEPRIASSLAAELIGWN